MSNYRKNLIVIPVLIFVLACQAVMRPIEEAQGGVSTAAAFATEIGGYATQASDLATQAAPLSTLMANPSFVPGGNPLDPQSPPLTEWKGIPIMPSASAGDDVDMVYSFKVDASDAEIKEFYQKNLEDLGWKMDFDMSSILLFSKDNQTLTITIMPSEGGTIVLLTLS